MIRAIKERELQILHIDKIHSVPEKEAIFPLETFCI